MVRFPSAMILLYTKVCKWFSWDSGKPLGVIRKQSIPVSGLWHTSMSLQDSSVSETVLTARNGARNRSITSFRPWCRNDVTRGRAENGLVEGGDFNPGLGSESSSRLK